MSFKEITEDQVKEDPRLFVLKLTQWILEQPGEVKGDGEEGLTLEFKKDAEYPVVDPREEKWICEACNKEFNGITIIEHNRLVHNFP